MLGGVILCLLGGLVMWVLWRVAQDREDWL